MSGMAPTGSPARTQSPSFDIDPAQPRQHRIIPAIMPDDQDAPEIAERPGINDPAVERRDDRGAGNRVEAQALVRHRRRAGLAAAADDRSGHRRDERRMRRHGALSVLPRPADCAGSASSSPIPRSERNSPAGSVVFGDGGAGLLRDPPVRPCSRCLPLFPRRLRRA